jgi:uncharacterized protein YlxW (UPF0749 family)
VQNLWVRDHCCVFIGISDASHNGTSSGYHSSAEDVNSSNGLMQQHLSSLEHENQLLKNEVASLSQEMQSVIRRVQATQEGV